MHKLIRFFASLYENGLCLAVLMLAAGPAIMTLNSHKRFVTGIPFIKHALIFIAAFAAILCIVDIIKAIINKDAETLIYYLIYGVGIPFILFISTLLWT